MIVSSMSIYAAAAFAPAAVVTAVATSRAEAPREPATAPTPVPPSVTKPDEEAVLRERYFEEMVSSAADLLLRTQTGQATRFDP